MAKVLVADDNPHVLRTVQETLGPVGHDVVEVSDGKNLLERIAEARPDLILLDTTLPGANSLEVCQGVLSQRNLDGCRLVLLAGPLETPDDAEAAEAGVGEVVQKPLDTSVLERLVAGLPTSGPEGVAPTPPSGQEIVDSLIHQALGPEVSGPSREAVRREIEAVVRATMPAIVDRLTDRLLDQLRKSRMG